MPAGYLNKQGYLLPQSERQFAGELVDVAIRGRKGLSVFLSIESLPVFRRPAKFGGSGKDPLWQIDDKNIRGDLEALQDSPMHVSIVPSVTMSLERYEAALANTQNDWEIID
ncbi:hypothetical protein [Oscillatoria acuminata]|uniref:Tse2 ADP-ribosyltransferase toxin domain-containing protein n=1 Tax=Oscillatoria acuminata PCC 6304 TaxID=56110 RepID=K9TE48_9CYAN|nr:hypothetical protein [Oscillatoria acuminata]AFY80416.1 hypothetical protein Oscil6304_0677 [Oscillatoria acuminata PCC 6304]